MDRGSIIREQEASGLSVVEFCTREGIRPNNFYNWRNKLIKLQGSSGSMNDGKNRFARVETQSLISLELENGVKLRVSVSDLKAVLMALR